MHLDHRLDGRASIAAGHSREPQRDDLQIDLVRSPREFADGHSGSRWNRGAVRKTQGNLRGIVAEPEFRRCRQRIAVEYGEPRHLRCVDLRLTIGDRQLHPQRGCRIPACQAGDRRVANSDCIPRVENSQESGDAVGIDRFADAVAVVGLDVRRGGGHREEPRNSGCQPERDLTRCVLVTGRVRQCNHRPPALGNRVDRRLEHRWDPLCCFRGPNASRIDQVEQHAAQGGDIFPSCRIDPPRGGRRNRRAALGDERCRLLRSMEHPQKTFPLPRFGEPRSQQDHPRVPGRLALRGLRRAGDPADHLLRRGADGQRLGSGVLHRRFQRIETAVGEIDEWDRRDSGDRRTEPSDLPEVVVDERRLNHDGTRAAGNLPDHVEQR